MHYQKSIRDIVETIKREYAPEKIILFGSSVSGKVTEDSDIDMLIVKETEQDYGQRWLEVGRLVRHLHKPLPFEPFILTPQELRCELERNLFVQEIISKGKVLYEKN